MIKIRRFVSRRAARSALAASVGSSAAMVVTRAEAFEIAAEQREARMGDACRMCGSEIPDVDHVLVCMRAKKPQVSGRCKATIPKNPGGVSVRQRRLSERPVHKFLQRFVDAQPSPTPTAGLRARLRTDPAAGAGQTSSAR